MCSIASTGSSSPTIRPTSRAQSPPAFTTCSASHRAVLGDDVPGAARLLGQLHHPVAQHDRRPELLRRLGVGVRRARPGRDAPRPGPRARRRSALGSISGNIAAASRRRDDLGVHAEAAPLGVREPQEVHPHRVAGQHHPAGQVQAARLPRELLELAVERHRIGLQLRDVRVAVQRVEPARRVPARPARQLRALDQHRRRSSPPSPGGRAPSSRRRRRRSPPPAPALFTPRPRRSPRRAPSPGRVSPSITLKWCRPGSIVSAHVDPEPGPDVGDQRRLPHELRPLVGADPDMHPHARPARSQQRRALGRAPRRRRAAASRSASAAAAAAGRAAR